MKRVRVPFPFCVTSLDLVHSEGILIFLESPKSIKASSNYVFAKEKVGLSPRGSVARVAGYIEARASRGFVIY